MKKYFIQSVINTLCCLCLFAPNAYALTCKQAIIKEGDRQEKVLNYCGPPSDKNEYDDTTTSFTRSTVNTLGNQATGQTAMTQDQTSGVTHTDKMAVWTYNFGPQSFMQILTFRNGRLEKIEQGEFGHS